MRRGAKYRHRGSSLSLCISQYDIFGKKRAPGSPVLDSDSYAIRIRCSFEGTANRNLHLRVTRDRRVKPVLALAGCERLDPTGPSLTVRDGKICELAELP